MPALIDDFERIMPIPLSFDVSYRPDSLVLLEIPSEDIEKALTGGDGTVVIKGDGEEAAVLCTGTDTYEMREAETSNNVYLSSDVIPGVSGEGDGGPCRFVSSCTNFLEIRKTAPRLGKLRDLLEQSLYRGEEEEEHVDVNQLYRMEDLERLVQASREEIKCGLRSMDAVEINGYWRL